MVGLLDSPLPAEYAPAKLLPSGYERYLGTGRLIPVMHQNQHRNAFVMELPDMDSWGTRNETCTNYGSTSPRYAFSAAVWGHDSGNPCFMLAGEERLLLYSTHIRQANGAPGGPHTTRFAVEIQAALDSLSTAAAIPNRYLCFFDFSTFIELTNGGVQ